MVIILIATLVIAVISLVLLLFWVIGNKQKKKINVVSRKQLQEERDFYKKEWQSQLDSKQAYMDRMKEKANKWEGKFVVVKNENNKLRKQVAVSEQAIDELSDRLSTVINQAKKDQEFYKNDIDKLHDEVKVWKDRASKVDHGVVL